MTQHFDQFGQGVTVLAEICTVAGQVEGGQGTRSNFGQRKHSATYAVAQCRYTSVQGFVAQRAYEGPRP